MLNVDDYVNNAEDEKGASDWYEISVQSWIYQMPTGMQYMDMPRNEFGTIMAKLQASLIVTHFLIRVNTR